MIIITQIFKILSILFYSFNICVQFYSFVAKAQMSRSQLILKISWKTLQWVQDHYYPGEFLLRWKIIFSFNIYADKRAICKC